MDAYKRHIELLGYRATDKITGFAGVIDSVGFDLYGCVQAAVKPPMTSDGKVENGLWFDVQRLDVDRSERVVEFPDFAAGYVAEGRKGPAEKPMDRA